MNKRTRLLAAENEREEARIAEESQEVYTDMVVYLRVSQLSEYIQELVRSDIIHMILDGQERGQSVDQVIGGDYKEFCDEIINAFPSKSLKQKFFEFFDMTCMCLYVLGTISVIFNVIDNILQKNPLLTYSLSAADVVNFIVIMFVANLVVYVICKGALQAKKKESKVKIFVLLFLFFLLLTGTFVGAHLLLSDYALQFHMVIAVAVIALAYVVHKAAVARAMA